MNDDEWPEAAHVAARRLADTIDELYARDDAPEWADLADAEDRARALRARVGARMPQIERALYQPHAPEEVRVRRGRTYYALLTGAACLVELCDTVDGLGNAHDDAAVVLLERALRPAARAADALEAAVRHAGEEDAALLADADHDEPRPCLDAPPRGAVWQSARDVVRAGEFLLGLAVAGLPIDGGLDALITDRRVLSRQVVALKKVASALVLFDRVPLDSSVVDRIQSALFALETAKARLLDARPSDGTADARQAYLLEALRAIGEARDYLVSVRDLTGPEHEPALAAAGRAIAE